MIYFYLGIIAIVLGYTVWNGVSITIGDIKLELYSLKRLFHATYECRPPNITYCKKEIHPDFDCMTCKWNRRV